MLRPDGMIPLNSGAYVTRSPIGLNEKCINLYQEINPSEAEPTAAVTHYTRPGLISLGLPLQNAVGRGVFTASNGNFYSIVGQYVYAVDETFAHTQIGQIGPQSTPVSISDNGNTAVLVDGTHTGYTFNINTNAFAPLVDPTGLFQGSPRVDYADTFLAFSTPGTTQWYTSLSNTVSFNALIAAAKSSYPDPIRTLSFNLRQMWLIGSQTSEIWYLTGAANFPYAALPQVQVPYGTVAPYSLAKADVNLFWLSKNAQGQTIVVQTEGYGVQAVSTRALETEFTTYVHPEDAVAYTYQQGGHTFYCITFQRANKSWAYDLSTKQWHQRGWIDSNGVLNRERVGFVAFAYGKVVGQDWQTGELYELSLQAYTDKGTPIVCTRTFPHIVQGLKEITHCAFIADMAFFPPPVSGGSDWNGDYNLDFGPLATDNGPTVNMRYSNNGGVSWSNYRRKGVTNFQNAGYRSLMRWRGLGMARDRVYELSWSFPALVALQGAYVDPQLHSA